MLSWETVLLVVIFVSFSVPLPQFSETSFHGWSEEYLRALMGILRGSTDAFLQAICVAYMHSIVDIASSACYFAITLFSLFCAGAWVLVYVCCIT